MRINGPNASPTQAPAAKAPEEPGASSARSEAPIGPGSLVDVRLIANPELARPKPPVQTPQEARRAAGEAVQALKAEPQRAVQVAGKVRPEAAAAAIASDAPAPAPAPTPAPSRVPVLTSLTLQIVKAEG